MKRYLSNKFMTKLRSFATNRHTGYIVQFLAKQFMTNHHTGYMQQFLANKSRTNHQTFYVEKYRTMKLYGFLTKKFVTNHNTVHDTSPHRLYGVVPYKEVQDQSQLRLYGSVSYTEGNYKYLTCYMTKQGTWASAGIIMGDERVSRERNRKALI
ncbi:hypothetical protein DPMN_162021 [Dreissena polymorpha]|uniref:Uncharacterized protein n=1 Tax=Dreissena polymorpha TaxID=45954 RepID=A0A9D4IRM5_DREPO|nr:hypothetical protein DPMN_162021 [Dreissena polymorpha]